MSNVILIPKQYTKFDHLKRVESKHRPVGQPKGSHLDDLMALRKAVILCRSCAPPLKRSAEKYGYRLHYKFPVVRGTCDLCREHDDQAFFFLHETLLPKPSRGSFSRIRF